MLVSLSTGGEADAESNRRQWQALLQGMGIFANRLEEDPC